MTRCLNCGEPLLKGQRYVEIDTGRGRWPGSKEYRHADGEDCAYVSARTT